MSPTPGPFFYSCPKCGWSGPSNGKPRCRQCDRQATAAWRAANPDKARAQKKAWMATPTGKAFEAKHKRERRARNPETVRTASARRHAWFLAGDVTCEDLQQIYRQAEGRCYYCSVLVERPRCSRLQPRGFDHIVPRIHGGEHTRTNIVVCCKRCNVEKAKGERNVLH